MIKATYLGAAAVAVALVLSGCAVPPNYGYGGQPAYQQPAYQQPTYQAPAYQPPPSYPPPGYQSPDYQSQGQANGVLYGRVESIDTVPAPNNGPNVLGTVVGGAAGGLLGNQIGGGRGRTAATIGGALIGALAGNQVEQQMGANNVLYRIRVRLNDGRIATVTQASPPNNVQIGSRVQVVNNTVVPY
ncbi:MAG: glycine zipper 2TM domain-containing protein [Burkholderiales bacterium]|nr:glycine zipper 2TM domain-containing protein [Burkholderiales bacterium]MDE2290279.1 glycine zipper 2TM domain-containing protein [Burkholderiales bacterium]MDE2608319.1 glycine zipper 2TM domain-containing protein [Burkholderiales bacterium]